MSVFESVKKLASDRPSTRKVLVPLLKEASVKQTDRDKEASLDILPKPHPWTGGVDWSIAEPQVHAILDMFEKVGCEIVRIPGMDDSYVILRLSGMRFELGVGRKRIGLYGNLFIDVDDAKKVIGFLPKLISISKKIVTTADKKGTEKIFRSLLETVVQKKFAGNKMAAQLALGIMESVIDWNSPLEVIADVGIHEYKASDGMETITIKALNMEEALSKAEEDWQNATWDEYTKVDVYVTDTVTGEKDYVTVQVGDEPNYDLEEAVEDAIKLSRARNGETVQIEGNWDFDDVYQAALKLEGDLVDISKNRSYGEIDCYINNKLLWSIKVD